MSKYKYICISVECGTQPTISNPYLYFSIVSVLGACRLTFLLQKLQIETLAYLYFRYYQYVCNGDSHRRKKYMNGALCVG